MRTVYSDTYRNPKGGFVDRVSAVPVNYRDSKGRMRPINDSFRRAEAAYVNVADSYRVVIPTRLSGASPIRVTRGSELLRFTLLGARGEAASVRGNTVRFANVMRGVALAYSADPGELKESILFGRQAAADHFRFFIQVSRGLRLVEAPHGRIVVRGAGNQLVFSLPMPFLRDTRTGGVGRVASRLSHVHGGYLLVLVPSRTWLHARGRHWPVLLDPDTLDVYASTDCTIMGGSLASQNSCNGTSDTVGVVNGNPERALLYFNIAGTLPADANVTFANIGTYITSWANASQFEIGVYGMTRPFTSGATWNTYDGTHNWTTAGGDFDANPVSDWTPSTTTGWADSYITPLVRTWVNGSRANDGIIIKATSETINNSFQFESTWNCGCHPPVLAIDWWPHIGYPRNATILNTQLTRRLSAGVNVANGNLILNEEDMHIAGTGLDLNMNRVYNGLVSANDFQDTGSNFILTGEPYIYQFYPDGSIVMADSDYSITQFTPSGNGTWTTSPGSDATICEVGVGPGCPSVPSGTAYHVAFRNGVSYNFDGNGNLLTVVDKNGKTITVNWNPSGGCCGLITGLKDTQGRTLAWNRDPTTSQLTGMTDSSGRSVGFTYNTSDQPITFTDGDNYATNYSWNTNGNLTQITDANGNETKFTYDSSWRVTSMTRVTNLGTGAGDTWNYAYVASNTPIPNTSGGCPSPGGGAGAYGQTVVTDPRGNATYYCYDTADRVYATYNAKGIENQASFDNDNNITQTTDPAQAVSTFGYDSQERPKTVTEPVSHSGQTAAFTTLTYNQNSTHPYFPDASTDAQGKQLSYGYDAATNLSSITDQLTSQNNEYIDYNGDGSSQHCTTITTDTGPKGTVRCVKDADGNETVYRYDSNGNLTSITPPAATNGIGATTFGYDSLSRVTSITDGKNQTEQITYDGLDQITKKTFADASTITYTYDKDGNLTQQVDSVAGTTTYTYDAKNRLTQETLPGGKINTYTYNPDDEVATLQNSGGTTTYNYDTLDRLCWALVGTSSNGCSSVPSGAITFGYDNEDRRTAVNYPNGVNITYGYWPNGALNTLTATGPGSRTITNLTYNYQQGTNDRDLLQTLTDGVAAKQTCYSYDALNRLIRAATYSGGTCTGSPTDNRQYSYDGAGNILTRTINSPTPTTYSYNADNELCWQLSNASSNGCGSPPTGATSYTYDKNGNETGSSAGLGLTYNARNQTTSIMPAGGSATTLAYNGDGQDFLTGIGSITQTNDLLGVGYRTDSSGTTYYTHDPNGQLLSEKLPSGSTYYYIPDNLGSVIDLTDSSGNTANTYSYDPYGQTTSSTGSTSNVWGYAQGLQVPAGLYHYGQRYMDPSLGRWSQQDPLSQPFDLHQSDAYGYAGADPIDGTDPSGEVNCAGQREPCFHYSAHSYIRSGMPYGPHGVRHLHGGPSWYDLGCGAAGIAAGFWDPWGGAAVTSFCLLTAH